MSGSRGPPTSSPAVSAAPRPPAAPPLWPVVPEYPRYPPPWKRAPRTRGPHAGVRGAACPRLKGALGSSCLLRGPSCHCLLAGGPSYHRAPGPPGPAAPLCPGPQSYCPGGRYCTPGWECFSFTISVLHLAPLATAQNSLKSQVNPLKTAHLNLTSLVQGNLNLKFPCQGITH